MATETESVKLVPLWFARYQNLFFTQYTPKAYYAVSKDGNVINSKTGRILIQTKDKKSKTGSGQTYPYIKLKCSDNKYHRFKTHRLIAAAYCPNSYNKNFVHHIDRNKENNASSNLLWVRRSEHRELEKLWLIDREKYFQQIKDIIAENSAERKDNN